MKLFNSNSQIDIYDNDYIDEKLMEAEEQIKTKTKRYSKEELLKIINNIIDTDENEICENK